MPSDTAQHVRVFGRVQGVGYRAWLEQRALAFGLRGWVRNRRDGTVEAILVGVPDVVVEAIQACHDGPFAAEVARVEAREATAAELAMVRPGERFSLLATA